MFCSVELLFLHGYWSGVLYLYLIGTLFAYYVASSNVHGVRGEMRNEDNTERRKMIGPILCAVARAAAPTLAQVFAREAVRAAAMAAGTAAVYGASRVIRDQYERRQREMPPQLENQRGSWN